MTLVQVIRSKLCRGRNLAESFSMKPSARYTKMHIKLYDTPFNKRTAVVCKLTMRDAQREKHQRTTFSNKVIEVMFQRDGVIQTIAAFFSIRRCLARPRKPRM